MLKLLIISGLIWCLGNAASTRWEPSPCKPMRFKRGEYTISEAAKVYVRKLDENFKEFRRNEVGDLLICYPYTEVFKQCHKVPVLPGNYEILTNYQLRANGKVYGVGDYFVDVGQKNAIVCK